MWNDLDLEQRKASSTQAFKLACRKCLPEPNILYFYGQRWPAVQHARKRMGCSALTYDLCYKVHVIDDPSCSRGASLETTFHYFFDCPKYTVIRRNMIANVEVNFPCTLKSILHGCNEVSYIENCAVFDAVHKFIIESKRFT